MKLKTAIATTIVATAISTASFAGKDVTTFNAGMASTSITGLSDENNFYLSLERGSKGTRGQMMIGASYQGVVGDTKNLNFYFKPGLVLGDAVIFIKAGYGSLFGGGTSDSSFSYGAGASYNFTKNLGISAGYDTLYKGTNFDVAATKLGLKYDF